MAPVKSKAPKEGIKGYFCSKSETTAGGAASKGGTAAEEVLCVNLIDGGNENRNPTQKTSTPAGLFFLSKVGALCLLRKL
jgi:hypothetical protein